jgi:ketosteroid isomerase-like protein
MLLGGCATMVIAGCGETAAVKAPAAADTARVADEVKAAIRSQIDAYAARDPVKAGSVLAPDIITMLHGAPNIVGTDAAHASTKAQMTDPAMQLAVSDERVEVAQAGDMAIYYSTYRFTHTNPESSTPAVETGNWVAVFRRQPDGTMKMSREMILDTGAPVTAGS